MLLYVPDVVLTHLALYVDVLKMSFSVCGCAPERYTDPPVQ